MDSDGSHIILSYGLISACLLLAARIFFTCCEAACTEISDAKVKSYENDKGNKGRLFRRLEKPSALINAFAAHRLLNAFLIAFDETLFVFPFMRYYFHSEGIGAVAVTIAAVLISIIIIEALGDILPRRLMRGDKADSFAVFCIPAVELLCFVMRPITAVSEGISRFAALIFGQNGEAADETVTEEEILLMVDAGNETGSIESSEREMINNVFEFHEMIVSEVMTHRTDITAVNIDAEISEVVVTAINSGFSRIPVYSDSIDHIEGMIYVKDLLCLISTKSAEGITVRSFLRDAEYVPEACPCDELFKRFTENKLQLAVVVDEYGGTAGLVTMEDLVEAIVGNIQDEYDNESEDMARISDNVFMISGTADAADIMEELGCPLPRDSEYDTMSGFITDLLGNIPDDGETPSVSYENITFTVLVAEDMRIEKLKAVINTNEKTEKENEQNGNE